MGVRGLQTFLEQYCPSACFTVKIQELAKKYRDANNKEPVMVIDAQSCYSLWCKGMDWVIGFEMQEFLARLRLFVQAFKLIGVKIVFFFGGLTVEKKRQTWITRRLKNIRDVFATFDFLDKGTLSKNIPEKYNSLPPTMGLITSLLLKYVLNCEVHLSIEECDEEIIEYAHRNDCFAIFGQDTDFIISDLKACVLSAKNFDVSTMTTLIYDRTELAKILRIKISQLPLLAVLAGNDLINYEIIKGFHCMICNIGFEQIVPYDVLLPAIGKYINALPDQPIEMTLKKICVDLFRTESKLDLVKSCYESYLVKDVPRTINPTTTWSRILQIARYRHRNAIVPAMLWAVLNDRQFEFSVAFEDLRRAAYENNASHHFIASATVSRKLRQKLYGILLYEYEGPHVTIAEWCGENPTSYQRPVIVEPIMPIDSVQHPGLLVLWSDNNSERMSNLKWKLFLSSISPKIPDSQIRNWKLLTEDLVGVTAALYYLFEQGFMSGYEMFAVMATVATYPLYSRERLQDLYYGAPHPRSMHLSIAVIRTFSIVLSLMAACGYPVPVSGDLVYLKFEAKLFQIKYKEMKQKRTYQELCENDKDCLDVFYSMKTVLSKALAPLRDRR